jgi:hypothetical protein
LSTDGHGETSIPPYNFIAGGIIKLEAQPTEPVSLTFYSALRKLNTEPSIGASHQISVHFGKAVSEKKIFRNQPKIVCGSHVG